ncbi:MAG: SpoIIE family protein phosphatase [Candidatus Eremiobacteraeota bacterium]|nr:SpoIIE family protein phosphatase [Candidatus Eremiobacteraeota bacterium]
MSPSARRSLAVTAAVFVVALALLIVGGWLAHNLVAASVRTSERIRSARAFASQVLNNQLDEETGVRGYAGTHDPAFLEPYFGGRRSLGAAFFELRGATSGLALGGVTADIADAAAMSGAWRRAVALPLLRTRPRNARALQLRGKALMDRFRTDIVRIEAAIDDRQRVTDAKVQAGIDHFALFVGAAVALLGLLALVFLLRQSQLATRLEQARARAEEQRRRTAELRAAYVAEKRIADTLQDAFSQRALPTLPTLQFSATYVPATEETKVGGDWYDALELPANRVLFAIGDVAGHGINAAVTMNRARQALISAALLDSDPASVLARVNAELLREKAPMVTAVAGFADARTYEFVYSTAGHPPPLLLEPGREPRLLDCGGLPLGILSANYNTYRIQTVPGAMLVLYTDGAVEHSRNVIEGEELLLAAAGQAASRSDGDPATIIHDAIFQGRPVGDDVAILTIGFADNRRAGLTISADSAQQAFMGRLAAKTALPEAVTAAGSKTRPAERRPLRIAS